MVERRLGTHGPPGRVADPRIRWHVWARTGDTDSGRTLHWIYDDEQQARAMIERLLADGGEWRRIPDTPRPQVSRERRG